MGGLGEPSNWSIGMDGCKVVHHFGPCAVFNFCLCNYSTGSANDKDFGGWF